MTGPDAVDAELVGTDESTSIQFVQTPDQVDREENRREKERVKNMFEKIELNVTGANTVRLARCLECFALVQRSDDRQHYRWHRVLRREL